MCQACYYAADTESMARQSWQSASNDQLLSKNLKLHSIFPTLLRLVDRDITQPTRWCTMTNKTPVNQTKTNNANIRDVIIQPLYRTWLENSGCGWLSCLIICQIQQCRHNQSSTNCTASFVGFVLVLHICTGWQPLIHWNIFNLCWNHQVTGDVNNISGPKLLQIHSLLLGTFNHMNAECKLSSFTGNKSTLSTVLVNSYQNPAWLCQKH